MLKQILGQRQNQPLKKNFINPLETDSKECFFFLGTRQPVGESPGLLSQYERSLCAEFMYVVKTTGSISELFVFVSLCGSEHFTDKQSLKFSDSEEFI